MKLRHIVQGSTYYDTTERQVVYAYCGYEEEASGSGKHTVDVGDKPCEKCAVLFTRAGECDDDQVRP